MAHVHAGVFLVLIIPGLQAISAVPSCFEKSAQCVKDQKGSGAEFTTENEHEYWTCCIKPTTNKCLPGNPSVPECIKRCPDGTDLVGPKHFCQEGPHKDDTIACKVRPFFNPGTDGKHNRHWPACTSGGESSSSSSDSFSWPWDASDDSSANDYGTSSIGMKRVIELIAHSSGENKGWPKAHEKLIKEKTRTYQFAHQTDNADQLSSVPGMHIGRMSKSNVLSGRSRLQRAIEQSRLQRALLRKMNAFAAD